MIEMPFLLYLMLAFVLLYLGVMLGFYLLQDILIFRGNKLAIDHQFEFPWDFEEQSYVNKEGIQLNALWFKASSGHPKGLVFYHHGNSGDLQSWGERARIFLSSNYDVFMYDYRGYGKSTGAIRAEKQLHRDAYFLFNIIKKKYPPSSMVIYGISLGTGVASRLAARVSPKMLMLETPYYHFHEVVKFHYPFLPVKRISKYKLRTGFYLRKVKCPVYLFHGTDDNVIPSEASERLKKRNKRLKLVMIPDGKHNDLPEYPIYQEEVREALL